MKQLKTRSGTWGNNSKQVLLSFFVAWARNCATLYTIPAIMQLWALEWPTDFVTHSPEIRFFFYLRKFAGFLRVFYAEF